MIMKNLTLSLAVVALAAACPAQDAFREARRISPTSWDHTPDVWYHAITSEGGGLALDGTNGFRSQTGRDTQGGSNFVWGYFQPVTLEDGDRLRLTFRLEVWEVPSQGNNIRFGFFDSGGTRQLGDVRGTPAVLKRDDRGYFYRLATHPDSAAGNVSRYHASGVDGNRVALTSNFGRQEQLGRNVGTGVLLNNGSRTVDFELMRIGDVLRIETRFNGNLQDGGREVENPMTWTFDSIVFSAVAANFEYRVANVQVRRLK
jgi:hypothetical protein